MTVHWNVWKSKWLTTLRLNGGVLQKNQLIPFVDSLECIQLFTHFNDISNLEICFDSNLLNGFVEVSDDNNLLRTSDIEGSHSVRQLSEPNVFQLIESLAVIQTFGSIERQYRKLQLNCRSIYGFVYFIDDYILRYILSFIQIYVEIYFKELY